MGPAARQLVLKADAVVFERGQERIFGPLSFDLQEGEALLVKGGNGAGKTSLLRVLAGSLAASQGRIEYLSHAINHQHLARGAVYIGHRHGHKAELTCLQNLQFASGLLGQTLHESEIVTLLDSVGLHGYQHTQARSLSAGQNKRLALARLLLSEAKLWLLDEPYANLDLDGIELVNSLIHQHIREQGAVLLTTHGAYSAPPVPYRMLELSEARQ
jgi:heme exporter protein A